MLKRRGKSLLAFDPTTVVISNLPSVPLEQRGILPNEPCIYFVLDETKNIQYIGRAKSLCFRWQTHHRFADFKKIAGLSIAYLHVSDPLLLAPIEKAMIEHFDPPLNCYKFQGDRVTVHLKLDRPVRQEVIGNLHRQGLTMQDFFENLMQTLAADPKQIDHIRGLTSAAVSTTLPPHT